VIIVAVVVDMLVVALLSPVMELIGETVLVVTNSCSIVEEKGRGVVTLPTFVTIDVSETLDVVTVTVFDGVNVTLFDVVGSV